MRRGSTFDAGREVLAVLEPPADDRFDATGGGGFPRAAAPARLAGPLPISGTAAFRPPAEASDAADAQNPAEDDLDRMAALVLSAMEAGADEMLPRLSAADRRLRRTGRIDCRVRAQLLLWADGDDGEAWTLFTRDIDARAMGFICQDNLPLGYGGTLTFIGPGRRRQRIEATVTRCRPCSSGWYEGALHFNQPHPWLVEEIAAGGEMTR